MSAITIRSAVPADCDTVYRFLCELSDKVYDPDLFRQCFEINLRSNKNIYLVVEADHEVAGFLSCHGQLLLHHTGWVYEIQEMYVSNKFRDKGIGRQLLHCLEERLNNIGYDVLEVSSNLKREDAHRFYKSAGFQHTHAKLVKKNTKLR